MVNTTLAGVCENIAAPNRLPYVASPVNYFCRLQALSPLRIIRDVLFPFMPVDLDENLTQSMKKKTQNKTKKTIKNQKLQSIKVHVNFS